MSYRLFYQNGKFSIVIKHKGNNESLISLSKDHMTFWIYEQECLYYILKSKKEPRDTSRSQEE